MAFPLTIDGANYLNAVIRFRWFVSGKVRNEFDQWVELSRTA